MHGRTRQNPATRQERKQRTRRALLDASLELLEEQSFASLSLRRVTRAAGVVPTAFYRHFEDMDELGLALLDESFRTLRAMIRAARPDPRAYEQAIRNSVGVLVGYVHEHDAHFRFIVRERFGGAAVLRHAIRAEVRLFASELATDLARFPNLDHWSSEDLRLLAELVVGAMIATAEAVLDAPANDREAEAEILAGAERQLRMIVLGVPLWRSATRRPAGAAERQSAHAPEPATAHGAARRKRAAVSDRGSPRRPARRERP